MERRKSVLDGHWTSDAHMTRCSCGTVTYLLRRGGMVLLPISHRCPARETQENVMRTIRAEEAVGLHVTLGQAARRLAEALS